jgi:hypothetical protein
MAFKVEYRCFNCVATCPAEIHDAFHADRDVRRAYLDDTLKPLTHTRRHVEQQFVIDTPAARAALGFAPGVWRTPIYTARPPASTPPAATDTGTAPREGRRRDAARIAASRAGGGSSRPRAR